ncbi:RNA-binding S4 domain-containing protein [candidate division KSB1 bacterium]|nr:RNA-binding S4 domain-containing protein [candidate division KSB1 bacterium]
MENSEANQTIRLDRWLSFACIIKTRSQATKACEDGRIKVNDEVAKPSKLVRIGDKITIKYKLHQRTVDVLQIVNRNVSHAEARTVYQEHELSAAEKEALELRQLVYRAESKKRPKFKGRPTKRERRKFEQEREDWRTPDEDLDAP